MHTLSLFNHKGGVGKTTLTVNVADALVDLGFRVLMVDADPQCNLTSFYVDEKELDELLGESAGSEDEGGTIWSSIKPVVRGKGAFKPVEAYESGRVSTSAPATFSWQTMKRNCPRHGRTPLQGRSADTTSCVPFQELFGRWGRITKST